MFDINNPVYAARTLLNAKYLPKIENGIIYFNAHYANRGGAGFVIPIQSGEKFTISFENEAGEYMSEILSCENVVNGVSINETVVPQTDLSLFVVLRQRCMTAAQLPKTNT